MSITAQDLQGFSVCDHIIKESAGGAHTNVDETIENISEYISQALHRNLKKNVGNLLEIRYGKFRKIGEFDE